MPAKRRIAELIHRHAGRYGIEVRIALAVALIFLARKVNGMTDEYFAKDHKPLR